MLFRHIIPSWTTLASPYAEAVETACMPWDGVQFVSGGHSSRGIDCSRFAAKVLDKLTKTQRAHLLRGLPPFGGLMSEQQGTRAIRCFLNIYPELQKVQDQIEPGDLIVVGSGACHILIASKGGMVWSSSVGSGVSKHLADLRDFHSLYRAGNRECWLQEQNT